MDASEITVREELRRVREQLHVRQTLLDALRTALPRCTHCGALATRVGARQTPDHPCGVPFCDACCPTAPEHWCAVVVRKIAQLGGPQ